MVSADVLSVWREHGATIAKERAKPDHSCGRISIAKRYGLTERKARTLITLITRHGPTPPGGAPLEVQSNKVTFETDGDHATVSGSVRTLDELLDIAKVDRDKWRVVSWQARAWDAAIGDGKVRTMHYIRAALEPRKAADLKPVIHTGIPPEGYPVASEASKLERVLLLPDAQIGHRRVRRDGREVLVPMHDRAAMSCAWRVAQIAQPDTIVVLGDFLDLTEMSSKYPKPLDVIGTSQASINELAYWLRDLRERCPFSRIIYVEGNHEARLHRLIVEKTNSMDGLRAVDDDLAAMSISRLLGLPSLHIEYIGPYGEDIWLWPDTSTPVRVHHGEVVRSKGGQTVSAQLQRETSSVVGGHIHRVEVAWRTIHGPVGRRSRVALSPGCLCRVDGAVPGVTLRPDWQQGWGWLARDSERGQVYGAAVPIVEGRTVYRSGLIDAEKPEALMTRIREGSGLADLVDR